MEHTRYHFVGVGGISMSGIARLLVGRGYQVSGSDVRATHITRQLEKLGVRVCIGHDASNVNGATSLVVSAAVPPDNPEVLEARRKGLPVIARAEMLGRLMSERRSIAVAGTHGKTTTTAMVATVLCGCGLDPTVLLGGEVQGLGGNVRSGDGPYMVAEACEAYGAFLHLRPDIAVVTNIDADHLDYYGTLDGVRAGFARFLSQVSKSGCAVLCADDPNVREVASAARCRVVTYGFGPQADLRAEGIEPNGHSTRYTAVGPNGRHVEVRLSVPGRQNVLNSLAALAVGREVGLADTEVANALAEFRGVGRRFELLGQADGVSVVDDYAHHPAEIVATLSTAREWFRPERLVAVFQPHLYSRTVQLMDAFAASFRDVDVAYITEIYAARERPLPGVSASELARRAAQLRPGRVTEFVACKERIPDLVLPSLRGGDMVITLGAGNIREVGEALAGKLGCQPHGGS